MSLLFRCSAAVIALFFCGPEATKTRAYSGRYAIVLRHGMTFAENSVTGKSTASAREGSPPAKSLQMQAQ
jgi:hypothetical protein